MVAKKVDTVNSKDLPVPAGEVSVLDLIHAVVHGCRTLQSQAAADEAATGLTPMEGRVLGFFARHPGAVLRDLVAHSGRDKAQLARLVKSLRERGLLRAEEAADDRRQVHLRLTAAGQSVQRTLRQRARRLEQRALAGLSAAQRQRLIEGLHRIQANLASSGDPA